MDSYEARPQSVTARHRHGRFVMRALLGALLVLALVYSAIPPRAEARETTLVGLLTIVWGDPIGGAGTAPPPLLVLTDDTGTRHALRVGSTVKRAGDLLALNGRRVVASGAWTTGVQGTANESAFEVNEFRLANADTPVATSAMIGAQKWVTLLCRFTDIVPSRPPLTKEEDEADWVALDRYFREQSYGATSLAGSIVVGWFDMPRPFADYFVGTDLERLQRLANDCTAAADAAVYFPGFVGINLMFNTLGYEYGPYITDPRGTEYWDLTRDGQTRGYRMVWKPSLTGPRSFPGGRLDRTLIHEMGHCYGLAHIYSTDDFSNSNWDAMSGGYGFIAYHRDRLNWIPTARKYLATPDSNQVVALERVAAPPLAFGTSLLAQIPIAGSSTHFYTVEWGDGWEYERAVSTVVIHEVDTTRSLDEGHAQVVDPDGNGNPNDEGAQWIPGETFVDATNRIAVAILAADQTSFTVNIRTGSRVNDPPPRYTLSLTPTPGGGATANPPGPTYFGGTRVTLAAAPQPGYAFGAWTVDGTTTGVANPLALAMTRDHAVTAHFVPTAAPPGGLQHYPLPAPVRLLDTRGLGTCDGRQEPALAAETPRTEPARGRCGIPATARALVGNATVVASVAGQGSGWVTLWPSGQGKPTASNLNYLPGQIVPNAVTVGVGADGAVAIQAHTATHLIVDITGYYAPPGAGGLYYHPLPQPLRLLDTRAGYAACDTPGTPLIGGSVRVQFARRSCTVGAVSATIPVAAQAVVGNATIVTPSASGYATLFTNGSTPPTASNLNFVAGQIVPNAITVGLASDGTFRVYTTAPTHFIVDITGYYSTEAVDVNGQGLQYFPLAAPARLLDTRAGFAACDTPAAPISGGVTRQEFVRLVCAGSAIPTAAKTVVGNATIVGPAAGGYATLFPDGAIPTASNLNYSTGQIVPNAFVVGLNGGDGSFRIFTTATTHFILDLVGYFAP